MASDLVVVVPLWRRTSGMDRVATSLAATVPGARLVFVVSAGDEAMHYADFPVRGDNWTEVVTVPGPGGGPGDYARKINAGYRATSEPLIFTGADDIEFTDGWYEAARALMADWRHSTQVLDRGATLTGPFGLIGRAAVGVVGTVDQCNERTMNGTHSTHSLVARWYADQGCSVDQGNMIYHEGYVHEYCDDELVRSAMSRQAYAHAFDSIVLHHHPNTGRVADDETYQRGRRDTRASRRHFLQRRALWGDAILDPTTGVHRG